MRKSHLIFGGMELSPFLGGVKTLSFFGGREVLFPLGREMLFPSGRGDTLSFVWKGKGGTLSSSFLREVGWGNSLLFFFVWESVGGARKCAGNDQNCYWQSICSGQIVHRASWFSKPLLVGVESP